MQLKRLSFLLAGILLVLPLVNFAQEAPQLTAEEIQDYTEQTKQLVKYLEGTLNFLGDPEQVPSEKDIIINESYLKVFESDETQIEDDLDPNREMAMNKDVQAYMKDVVFFFKTVAFTFEVNSVDQLVNEKGQIYFKVTMNRNLQGLTITKDSLNNNQIRYMEVTLDPIQKDLKIVSLYTTKPDRRSELKYWWENMAEDWKGFFADSIFIYQPIHPEYTDAPTEFDTIPFSEILSFSDSTFVISRWAEDYRIDTLIAYQGDTMYMNSVTDSLAFSGDMIVDSTIHYLIVYDTLPADLEFIYRNLEDFVSLKELNISGNTELTHLKPVIELNELVAIDFSNTLINDLSPLRNHNKIDVINCSGSKVSSLDPLLYASMLKELNCSNTSVSDISVLSNLKKLHKLNLANTNVTDISVLSELTSLTQLNLSGLDINDLSALESLTGLSDLKLAGSAVTKLDAVGKITNLQNLNIDSTYVSRLDPLKSLETLNVLQANSSKIVHLDPLIDLPALKLIYCDNTGVDGDKATQFMTQNTNCLVIYNSQELEKWWNDLPPLYKSIVNEKMDISDPITKEQLHVIINQTSVDFSNREEMVTIEPLKMLHRLETVKPGKHKSD